MIKRLDRLDVATTDLPATASLYEKNFGFKVAQGPGADCATVTVGGAEIRLTAGAAAADALTAIGEGMFGLWLEAEDLDQAVASLKKAGVTLGAIRRTEGRRAVAVDPDCANKVPLYIFERK